jgi:hypothetical protein
MAERRMFSKRIIDSDAFQEMPHSAQALYFHLMAHADDDGFINAPQAIMRSARCGAADAQILLDNDYIIPFESGVIVIKHWRMHNYIQSDRYKPTIQLFEKSKLTLQKNGAYIMAPKPPRPASVSKADTAPGLPDSGVSVMDTECIHFVSKVDTQDRVRVGESQDRLDQSQEREKEILSSREENSDTGPEEEGAPEHEPGRAGYRRQAALAPARDDFAAWFEAAKERWNISKTGPPCRYLAINLGEPRLSGLLAAYQTYPDREEVARGILNYGRIAASEAEYDPAGCIYQSLESFLIRGLEKYVDEARPFERFRRRRGAEDAAERERLERIKRMAEEEARGSG